ncbi:MAG: DedA family protein [Gammaproteobacteria bacterium]|nr:DedA family protein [Gammaproteobacteria bacterium]
MAWLAEYGLWGLGLSALLAATVLPLSSELVLSALLIAGESPSLLLMIATVANVAGSVVNYLIGRWGADTILHRWFKLSSAQTDKAELHFNRYGKWSLLFAWVPIIGDPLTLVAGMLKVNLGLFILFVTLGKASRYWLISQAILASQS